MYHRHITRMVAEAHVADMRLTAARSRPIGSARPRSRRHAITAAVITLGALSPATAALAHPAHDVGSWTPKQATAAAPDHHPRVTSKAITFTNPLDRSRGPGAGAGLL